jgi:pre-mRNA-processing factor 17
MLNFSFNATIPRTILTDVYVGMVEVFAMPDAEFEAQRRTYTNFGYAINPEREFDYQSSAAYVGDVDKAIRYRGATVDNDLPREEKILRVAKKKRLAKGDASKVDGFMGPWAGFEGEVINNFRTTRMIYITMTICKQSYIT